MDIIKKFIDQPAPLDAAIIRTLSIDLETNDGSRYPLLEPGTPLPWPKDNSWRRLELLVPPCGQLFVEELRLKLMSRIDERHLLNEIWELPQAACPGDEIIMEYRVTAGKQFECRAFLGESSQEGFVRTIENPLVNVVNPGSTRLKIEETEARLRAKKGGGRENRQDFINLAQWYTDLNQQEKALHYLHTALRKINRPDNAILNLQGIYYMDLDDFDRADKAFGEALQADNSWSGPIFNRAILYRKAGRYEEALVIIEEAVEKTGNKDGAYLSMKAEILSRLQRDREAADTARRAMDVFPPLQNMNDWELGWYTTNAQLLKDDPAQAAAAKERKRRIHNPSSDQDDDTPRPVVKGSLAVAKKARAN